MLNLLNGTSFVEQLKLCSRAQQAESGAGRHLVFVVRLKNNRVHSYKDQQKACGIKKPFME